MDYLEWLARTPNGRRFEQEIDEALRRQAANGTHAQPLTHAHEQARRH